MYIGNIPAATSRDTLITKVVAHLANDMKIDSAQLVGKISASSKTGSSSRGWIRFPSRALAEQATPLLKSLSLPGHWAGSTITCEMAFKDLVIPEDEVFHVVISCQ